MNTPDTDTLLHRMASEIPDHQKAGILRNLHTRLLGMNDVQRQRYKELFEQYGPRFRSQHAR